MKKLFLVITMRVSIILKTKGQNFEWADDRLYGIGQLH